MSLEEILPQRHRGTEIRNGKIKSFLRFSLYLLALCVYAPLWLISGIVALVNNPSLFFVL